MTTIHWTSGISGQFGTAADWNPSQIPHAGDDVLIDAAGTYTVTSSIDHKIKTVDIVSTATLAVNGGTFTIANGTGTGENAGTIRVADSATLAIGGSFTNSGNIILNSTGDPTDLIIEKNTTLAEGFDGKGTVTLSAGGHNIIKGNGTAATLAIYGNTIEGAGKIGGGDLTLLISYGTIDGNSTKAALTLNTGDNKIINAASSVIEGTTAMGLVVASNVSNSGTIEALGTNARLRIGGTIANASGIVEASGDGAHVSLASATINKGTMLIGSNSAVETVAGSGLSVISHVNVQNSGTLEANKDSTLSITKSDIGTTGILMSNGYGGLLSIDGTVGAVSGAINGGEIEFKGPSAANISFTAGSVGTLKIDASTFTGTVSGLTGGKAPDFSNLFVFGDSTVDSGALQYLSPDLGKPNLTDRLQNALIAGGTDSPVGFGLMNSQLLAADFGITADKADTAYTTGGVIGGVGTNYAIAGALDAADSGNGSDPGNGGIWNINQYQQSNPSSQLLSTIDQIESYLNSSAGQADPDALYLISSGGNDATYASQHITGQPGGQPSNEQRAYLSAQAQTLANEIQDLYNSGAEHIVVNNSMGTSSFDTTYSGYLFSDLNLLNFPYIKSDIHSMALDVEQNPTAFGFTQDTVGKGIVGSPPDIQTDSALIEPDTTDDLTGWGLWGAPQTAAGLTDPTTGNPVPPVQQYAYLQSDDAELTHFFSDDQHLSAEGQLIQASFDYNLVADDAIDLTNIPYVPGNTKASYSGTSTSGTLTVTDGMLAANIALLGNYMASSFVTASDGGAGTLVMGQSSETQQTLLASAAQQTLLVHSAS